MESGSKSAPGRLPAARLVVVLCGVALAAGLLVLAPDLIALLTRPVKRWLIELLLQGIVIAYAIMLVLAVPGLIAASWRLLRARRLGLPRPGWARLALLCGTCLFGVVLLEAAAAFRQAWAHRLPALPDRFGVSARQTGHPASAKFSGSPALPDHFAATAVPEELRVCIIGESSAQGFPFCPRLSIGQIVAWQLQAALPQRKVKLDLLARGGAHLEEMHHKFARLEHCPDILIIYCGQNEFQARYPWSRTMQPPTAPDAPARGLADRLARWSPLCRFLGELISRNRLDAPPPRIGRPLIDWPMCTAEEWAAILGDFRQRLDAIVTSCERLGTLPILVIPPSNEGGFEPSRTVLPESVSLAERQALTTAFQAARSAESADPARAQAQYRELVARYPTFAEAHFRLGRLLERAGSYAEALQHYQAALNSDGMPLRFPAPFQQVYRDVAARHGVPLIDGPAVLRSISPHGILDDTLFHDAHHPTLRGHVALAQEVLRALHRHGACGWRGGPEPQLDPAQCAAHFQLDHTNWFIVCERSSEFYRYASITRYDPTERLAKARRYAQAAQQIRGGLPAEQTGIPGVGCPAQPGEPRLLGVR